MANYSTVLRKPDKSGLGFGRKSNLGMSKKLQRTASKLMPSDVTEEIFINNAQGSHIWDVDGNEYIDYKLGYGPVILGHSDPEVQKKVHEYDRKGVIYGLDHPIEIELAKKIRSLIPSAEMIRYFVTGTEATMNAIKIARVHTGNIASHFFFLTNSAISPSTIIQSKSSYLLILGLNWQVS